MTIIRLNSYLQFYLNVPEIEGILRQVDISRENRTAPDSLFVVDTDDLGSYANADVKESYSDYVILDAKMGTHYSLTITIHRRITVTVSIPITPTSFGPSYPQMRHRGCCWQLYSGERRRGRP